MIEAQSPAHPGYGSKAYRRYVLGVLFIIYALNFVDRILIGIVQEPIRREFHLGDGMMGLLGGPAFALLYTLLGIPFARWAERGNRISIIAIGVALWSAMTALCGFAANFVQLACARVGVGIGEAACTPPAHSVISDYFPAERRATALSIYMLGGQFGIILAAVGGGWLVQNFDWRVTFWALGVPGVLVAILFKLTVREPPRTGGVARVPGFGETLKTLAGKKAFWHFAFAAGLMAIVAYAGGQFLPAYLVRTYQLDHFQAATAYGLIAGISAAFGTYLGGALDDRLSSKYKRAASYVSALGPAIALPFFLMAYGLQLSIVPTLALLMGGSAFLFLYLGPTFAVAQSVVSPRMRATASAILLLVITLIGYGLGPPTLGALADYFANARMVDAGMSFEACRGIEQGVCAAARQRGLQLGMIIIHSVLIWPILHFLLAGKTLSRDRVS